LQYICSFIFKELRGVDFELTIDSESYRIHDGAKVNYSDTIIAEDEFRIQNLSLLFENDIKPQLIDCFAVNNYKAFFKTGNSDFPFDIFAASFYLLSRYEEYLPHEKDSYGRYAHENSLAYREGFLNLPLINIWVKDLAEKMKEKFSDFSFQHSPFNFQPTYDIDIAFSYKHKGLLRNIGGFIKSPAVERIKVLTGAKSDPFDCYRWLSQLHEQFNLDPVYFFLVAEKNGQFDKNILPHKNVMWNLIKYHAKKFNIGLHPSWQSGDNITLLKQEKELLEAMSETTILKSRQHYIRFNLPEGYKQLLNAGFSADYSMGYGSINGFRASVASSFYWYDLEKEMQTSLRIHPFCFMDANAYYEQKQSPEQTLNELQHYLSICKTINGTFISIWHNNFLGTAPEFKNWRDLYAAFIAQAQS
jgi:hypothetical protein